MIPMMRQLKSGDVVLNQVQIVSSLLCIDDCHDITEILLKVALNTIAITPCIDDYFC